MKNSESRSIEKNGGNAEYVRRCALEMERIDIHSHLQRDRVIADELRKHVKPETSVDGRIIAEGCRLLYGIDPGLYLGSDAPEELFVKAAKLRAQGEVKALTRALDVSHIRTQITLNDGKLPTLTPRFKSIGWIDAAIVGGFTAFSPDFVRENPDWNYYQALCGHYGELKNLDQYLDEIDTLMERYASAPGLVGTKASMAYTIGLEYGDPTLAATRTAFKKKRKMTAKDVKTVQDYALRHALLASQRHHLPIQFHTGHLIWGHGDLRPTNPMCLHNLLIDSRYKDLTFVLLHGGNPYIGEMTYLASRFPNVILDFTWLSFLTRARFRAALTEWLEVVPHDKICWGSDSNSLETIVGIDIVTRRQIATVLEDLMKEKILSEKDALNFLEQCYLKTPQRIYGAAL